ncbi:GDP-mannose transporter GONST3 [Vitis vinifera]|uniref:GDP-mannose transporter GONST3 n=1 Tax=Vitis vinifera TaxID=29760 RepID=A0A438J7A3_VITVI|nr:GDP-mannose transporter GONST3 [Vitis vinifera]
MSNDEENPKVRASQKAAGYCISASLLSIINKWAVMKFPYPGALTALQYFTSAAGVVICGWFKIIEHDPLDRSTMWRFLPAAVIFYLSLFTNSELLLHANVDTFIVFRSAVPIFVAIGETLYLKQPWPTMKMWLSLATIFGGSVLYVLTDYQLTFMAYSWALAYLISMSIDFVYIKHVVMTIGLNTWLSLSLGSLAGRAISATGFTVLGIVNKLLTVVINLIIWDKHSTFVGTVGLLICMVGGILYQQSASNKPKAATDVKVQESQEEQRSCLKCKAMKRAMMEMN